MLPILLNFGFIKIYTFGVFLVLAFFWGSFAVWKNIRLTSFKEEEVFDGLFFSLFGSLFVGRLLYVSLNFSSFGFDFFKFILINGYPGISIVGVLAGGILSFWLYCYIKKIKFAGMVDYAVSPLFLASAIGKIGSFFSGVEIGTKTKFILALRYAATSGMRHLTPLYESIFFFLGSYLAYRAMFMIRRGQLRRGFNFLFFIWFYSLVYFLFDGLKQYKILLFKMSLNGLVSGILLLTTSFYFLYYGRSLVFRMLKQFINSTKKYGRQANKKSPDRVSKSSD